MTTKYIVNNLTGQTISGDLTITGNLKSNNTGVYRALLTETGSITGTSINSFNQGLIVGETYTITSYQTDDDFSNIANIVSGNINETGCVFIATGETPNRWFSNSELVSEGNLIVDELENTLGFPIYWVANPLGGAGYYFAINNDYGPVMNTFARRKTSVYASLGGAGFGSYNFIQATAGVASIGNKDDVVYLQVYNLELDELVSNSLYYTPVQITIEQDLDTTQVDIYGTADSFPFQNVAYTIQCGDYQLNTFYCDNTRTVNDMIDLINLLNSDANTNGLGVFSTGGDGGIKLTIAENLKNQLCPDSELTFFVFND
jgi:hypothetical protein